MESDVEAVDPEVSKADAREEWFEEELEPRCLVFKEGLGSSKIFGILWGSLIMERILVVKIWEPAEVVPEASVLGKLHNNIHL